MADGAANGGARFSTDRTPPFPVEEGHTVLYLREQHGHRQWAAGYFARWTLRGPFLAVVRKPDGGELRVSPHKLRPSNDKRTVALRKSRLDWLPMEGAPATGRDATPKKAPVKRRRP